MEKTVSRHFLIISSFLLIFSSALPQGSINKSIASALPQEGINKPICQTKECVSAAQNLKESMNIGLDPCDNFYQYACGNWTTVHKTRNFMSQTTLKLRSEENNLEILDFLRQSNNQSEPEAVRKARKLFSLCLNAGAYIGRVEPIVNILQKIGLQDIPFAEDINRYFDYTTSLARANKLAGVKVYFNLRVSPNPYNRTENLITLKRPSLDMDCIMPMAGKPRTSSGEDAQIQARNYINKTVTAMCENSTSSACVVPSNPLMSTPHDWIIDQIVEQNNDFLTFMDETATLPPKTSSMPDISIHSLYQLQALSDSIANEVNATIPKLNWTRYIEEMFTGLKNLTLDLRDPHKVQIVIEQLDFVKNMLRFIYTMRTSLMSIERDIWWQVVTTLLPYADLDISDAKNNLCAFGGFRPTRESRCAAITIASFGMAISHGYSTKEQYRNAKTKIAQMLEHIRGSFEGMINQASWLDEKTRQRALIKLKLLKSNIVYPNTSNETSTLDDFYHDVQITDNFFNTVVSNIQTNVNETLSTLNQSNILNKEYWTSPNKVNGYYIPDRNAIVIPAGLIGGSVYNGSLRALDYGAIGSILGHELSHALDDSGRHYNEIGNIENWWQNETLNLYKEKVNCFVKAYANYNITLRNGFTLYGDVKNSIASLDENISDNVGFKLSLLAYRKSVSELGVEPLLPQFHNFTHEQLLTLAYANVLCENPTWTSIMSITNRVKNHSLNIIRVNAVLKNSKEFSEIWNCPKDSPMNPSDKCSFW